MRKIFMSLMVLWIFSGCTVRRAGDSILPAWKRYENKTPLAVPGASWTEGSLKYEMTEATHIHRYTAVEKQENVLEFRFKATNVSSAAIDINGLSKPKCNLTLSDGTFIPAMIWMLSGGKSSKLAPGEAGQVLLLHPLSLPEGARPKKLVVNGKTVATW